MNRDIGESFSMKTRYMARCIFILKEGKMITITVDEDEAAKLLKAYKLADKIKLVGFKEGVIEFKYDPGAMLPSIPLTLIPERKDDKCLSLKLSSSTPVNIVNTLLALFKSDIASRMTKQFPDLVKRESSVEILLDIAAINRLLPVPGGFDLATVTVGNAKIAVNIAHNGNSNGHN